MKRGSQCLGGVLALLIAVALCLPAAAQSPSEHIVQPGENLFRIALRYNTTVDALMQANGLASHVIYVGQRLILPGTDTTTPTAPPPATYTVQWGDSLSAIALRHGVTTWALLQANGLANANLIYVGQQLTIPGGSTPSAPSPVSAPASTYTVRPGDTLSGIAARFGTTTNALARLNGIANPAFITAGQVLRLAGDGANPPAIPTGGAKRIVVDLSEQHLYAYAGDTLVYSFVASTGQAPTYTRAGEFQVQSKIPNAYGAAWNIWMPHWLGIYWAGSSENGIHALPILPNGGTLWAGYLGAPISYGCVVLGTYEAKLLYDWAEIGTPVSIRY